jgi:hypothetical protein
MMAGRRPVDGQTQLASQSGLVSAAPPIESVLTTLAAAALGAEQLPISLKALTPQLATIWLGPKTTPSAAVKFTVIAPPAQLMSAIAASVHFFWQPARGLRSMQACGRRGRAAGFGCQVDWSPSAAPSMHVPPQTVGG